MKSIFNGEKKEITMPFRLCDSRGIIITTQSSRN